MPAPLSNLKFNLKDLSDIYVGKDDIEFFTENLLNETGLDKLLTGELNATGSNHYGQLGTGDTINSLVMKKANTSPNWRSVVCGFAHTVALKDDGTLWVWGRNNRGQLGLNDTMDRSSPVQLGLDNTWKEISTRANHVVAIKENKSLWGWGANTQGQLGIGDFLDRSSPVQISSSDDLNWNFCSAGVNHSLATRDTLNYLWGWGDNSFGQLGNGNILAQSVPIFTGSNSWTKIEAAYRFSAGLKEGTLFTWGRNQYGQLGQVNIISRSSPVQVSGYNAWSTFSCGDAHVLALGTNYALFAWGRNHKGQLGNNAILNRSSPTQIGTSTTWRKLAANSYTSFAIKYDGTLWSWGQNGIATKEGKLGLGDTIDRSSPVQLNNLEDWRTVSVGYYHSAAIRK